MEGGKDYVNRFIKIISISNSNFFYFLQIDLVNFRTNYIKQVFLDSGGAVNFFNQGIILYTVNVGDYFIGNLGDYLSAIGPVNFIPIVLGRVVAGSNYYAGYGVKMAHGKGKLRSGADILKKIGLDIVGIKD